MGLAESRKQVDYQRLALPTRLTSPRRVKISHDPNNTTWSRSNTGFGHRILASQGWTPGSHLGARDAPQAPRFTAASASHIRVLVRDDNLGLGAQRAGPVENQRTGHDAFQGLLGRLNGKSDEEVGQEKRVQEDMDMDRRLRTRYDFIRFVRGGLLVQDKIGVEAAVAAKTVRDAKIGSGETSRESSEERRKQRTGFTREKEDSQERPKQASSLSEKASKREAKEKRRAEKAAKRALKEQKIDDAPAANYFPRGIQEKTEKSSKRKHLRNDEEGATSTNTEDGIVAGFSAEGRSESVIGSQSLRKRKKDKRKCVAEEEQSTARHEDGKVDDQNASGHSSDRLGGERAIVSESTKSCLSNVQNHRLEGRHAIRTRFIMQKKRAMMDSKALDEIFAIR